MDHLDLSKFKNCSCGINIEDENCKVEIHYTLMGWFWWSMGTTATPKEITFYCISCDKIFERLTKKADVKYYIFYRKH